MARSGQDRTLGHAALVGCGFGMVLSALKMVRYLATRSKTRRTARANCRSTVSRQREASIVYERSAAPALGCRPSREGESTAPPASGTKPGARKAGASPPARSVALPENAETPAAALLDVEQDGDGGPSVQESAPSARRAQHGRPATRTVRSSNRAALCRRTGHPLAGSARDDQKTLIPCPATEHGDLQRLR